LLELITVIVIIAILCVLLLPMTDSIRRRTEKVRCNANLKALYVGANTYLQQYGRWPQVPSTLLQSSPKQYARTWVETLAPYGLQHQAWICPTVQRLAGEKDFDSDKGYRIDYLPMTFDEKPITPYRWRTAPWFVERADVHGNGQLIIFTDGSIRELKEVAAGR
jgi:type II secretory pathway pseudopilin PulG